ncbi:hypothetical protein HX017_02725 [Myroides marinus]|uniref:Tetratricopeptide repeat-containing protein n=1 Tax=Myroides marinus TaxID=703342 RepID=A0A1H6R8C6_9FLAO|nr:hypothetical protein [Myroides marinus]MDM1346225.1 hypothetical protein [Myroides marinus]MDM1349515.1 hypothetical protein [Myroides marinus]MDM1356725.1 hypothetical protein [Myroides marinus]MDM1363867.1 hypothetical protein [Myroides marinus]MDM1379178.1 hypothetical protein [Myroides marinus]
MSIECIRHIENSCEIKQRLALEQESQNNYTVAINYYLEALGRIELLCSSYNAYIELGPSLYIQYIETSLKLAKLYKKEDHYDKYHAVIHKIKSFIINLKSTLNNNKTILNQLNSITEKIN